MRDDKDPKVEVDLDRLGSREIAPNVGFETTAIRRVEGSGDSGWTNGGTHGLPPSVPPPNYPVSTRASTDFRPFTVLRSSDTLWI